MTTARPLAGQVAVVTGASSGLGWRFARVLGNAGAAVALMARRTDRLLNLVSQIEADGGRAVAIPLDVAKVDLIGPALDEAQAALGSLSILVNNAGVAGDGRAMEISVETWDHTFDVNVRGVFFAAREAAQRMLDNGAASAGTARIVNITSIGSTTVLPGLPAYCASKAAAAMVTRSLARELARHGIAVNALAPGYVATELTAEWLSSEGGLKQINSFPRRRLMAEEALDDGLLLLCGPGAKHMTGATLTIDDGQTL
jgi:NAD(P)-dependent dehydrogenase (short-subunit alcohol dehydrogenase family)